MRINTSSNLQNCTNVLGIRPTWKSVQVSGTFRTVIKFNQKLLLGHHYWCAGAHGDKTAAMYYLCPWWELSWWGWPHWAEIKLISGWRTVTCTPHCSPASSGMFQPHSNAHFHGGSLDKCSLICEWRLQHGVPTSLSWVMVGKLSMRLHSPHASL